MNLEDHLGDIVRKGRAAAQVTSQAAAQASGISEAELTTLEESGQAPPNANLDSLAQAIRLHPGKLRKIAQGWLPAVPDLARWCELRVVTTASGGIAVNAFVVLDEVSREAAIFDTGWEAAPILKLIEENKLEPRHLFLTHLHHDHVGGMGAIRERFPKIHLHTNSTTVPPQHRNRANDCLHLGSLRITNRDTPGHAAEGVTYIIGNWPEDAPHVAIVGDAIFAGSIGRGNQSWDLACQKISEQIFTLPLDTLICPGHGPLTTVAEEKTTNPFFQ